MEPERRSDRQASPPTFPAAAAVDPIARAAWDLLSASQREDRLAAARTAAPGLARCPNLLLAIAIDSLREELELPAPLPPSLPAPAPSVPTAPPIAAPSPQESARGPARRLLSLSEFESASRDGGPSGAARLVGDRLGDLKPATLDFWERAFGALSPELAYDRVRSACGRFVRDPPRCLSSLLSRDLDRLQPKKPAGGSIRQDSPPAGPPVIPAATH